MDLIGDLASQLNLPQGQAKGLAGGVLSLVQGALKDDGAEDDAKAFGDAVPEAAQWAAEGEVPGGEDEGGGLGDLLGAGMSMLGASKGSAGLASGVAALIQKFGLEPSHAAIAAPLITKFIESKVDPALLAKVQPMLALMGGGEDGGGGGLGGMLGGLLG